MPDRRTLPTLPRPLVRARAYAGGRAPTGALTHAKRCARKIIKEHEEGDGLRVQGARAGLSRGGHLLDRRTARRGRRPVTQRNVAAREEVSCARNGAPACKESGSSSRSDESPETSLGPPRLKLDESEDHVVVSSRRAHAGPQAVKDGPLRRG